MYTWLLTYIHTLVHTYVLVEPSHCDSLVVVGGVAAGGKPLVCNRCSNALALRPVLQYAKTLIHTRTRNNTPEWHIQLHTLTRTHTHTCTHKHTHTHTHHMYIHTRWAITPANFFQVQTQTHTKMPQHMHAHTKLLVHAPMHTCTMPQWHAYMHYDSSQWMFTFVQDLH